MVDDSNTEEGPGSCRSSSDRRRVGSDEGLALLDVLIGMAIFALIAIIGTSALGQFRSRGYETQSISDARTIGVMLEGDFVDSQSYPTTVAGVQALMTTNSVSLTDQNVLADYSVTGQSFQVCVEGPAGAWATYNSAQGGIIVSGRSGGC